MNIIGIEAVSDNANITMEFIETHPEYNLIGTGFQKIQILQWNSLNLILSINGVGLELYIISLLKTKKHLWKKKHINIWLSKIKQWWKEICLSPNTKVGKKRREELSCIIWMKSKL